MSKHPRTVCPVHPWAVVKFGYSPAAWAVFRCGCEWQSGKRVVKGTRR